MTLSEFRSYAAVFHCADVRRAIAAVLPGRTFRTPQDFSDFYEAVCRQLRDGSVPEPELPSEKLVA